MKREPSFHELDREPGGNRTSLQHRTRRAFIWVLIVPVALGVFTLAAAQRYRSSIAWVSHTKDVLAAGDDLLLTMTDAQSDQRGFLLTGNEAFLSQYAAARDKLPGKLVVLRQLTNDNPKQQANIRRLSSLIQVRVSKMEKVLALRPGGHLPEVQAIEAILSGTTLMAQIRQEFSDIADEENRLLAERIRKERLIEIELGSLFAIGIATSLFLLYGAYRVIQQYAAMRDDAEEAIRTINANLETRIRERTAELEGVNRMLARSNRDLTQFAYIASHDLQEPLRTVGSYAGMLARKYEGKLDEQADKYIRFVVDGAMRMQNLVRDLLAYSRAGTGALNREFVNVSLVLERAKESLHLAITEHKAQITTDSLPAVSVDAGRLAQVFQNLIGNALKFSKPEESPAIHIGAWRDTREWVFVVSDNGIGFEPEYAQKIFVIFQRLHRVGAYTGTGLGLAICQRIIETHGGRIWAESEPGVGSKFFFTLPDTGERNMNPEEQGALQGSKN